MKHKPKYRCQLHPATDAWMKGDRYGEIIDELPSGNKKVRIDKSQKTVIVKPEDILEIFQAI